MRDTVTLEVPLDDMTRKLADRTGGRIALDPDTVEQDLARLVLGLIAFLRQLMELQAIRQFEANRLTPEQEERLGMTLMKAEDALFSIAAKFGLEPDDLSLDLGPLGKTI